MKCGWNSGWRSFIRSCEPGKLSRAHVEVSIDTYQHNGLMRLALSSLWSHRCCGIPTHLVTREECKLFVSFAVRKASQYYGECGISATLAVLALPRTAYTITDNGDWCYAAIRKRSRQDELRLVLPARSYQPPSPYFAALFARCRLPLKRTALFSDPPVIKTSSRRAERPYSDARLHRGGSKLDPRSDLRLTRLEIEMKFISNHRNWRFEISIRDQQPSCLPANHGHSVLELPNSDWPSQPMRVIEVNMERRRNEGAGETEHPRENPPTGGIVRQDSHMRKVSEALKMSRCKDVPLSRLLLACWEAFVSNTRKKKKKGRAREQEKTAFSGMVKYVLVASEDYNTDQTTGEPGSIPGGVAPVFSHVGIVPHDASGRRVFSGISRFPPSFHSRAAPCSPLFALIGSQDPDVKSGLNLSTPLNDNSTTFIKNVPNNRQSHFPIVVLIASAFLVFKLRKQLQGRIPLGTDSAEL
ncbi:hypothetical protein PR048_033363 [Dryococelus australis]|uniref:Uncharacterized protein n=1 Tax=Dryococelus australis TaxID=614101 RepID=A0ABQ9G2X1_9NEOP|nr:hypothetical protein PR048_033363 [Dryococelus australis]